MSLWDDEANEWVKDKVELTELYCGPYVSVHSLPDNGGIVIFADPAVAYNGFVLGPEMRKAIEDYES